MKKFFIALLFTAVTLPSMGQVKFGLRFAPNLALNRVINDLTDTTVTKNGAGARFSFGPTLDFIVSDHVAFSTGLWFTSKRASIEYKDSLENVIDAPIFKLHYLQIPVSIKYYTNEISDGMKIYFQLGGTVDVNIAQDVIESTLSKADQKTSYDNFAKIVDGGGYVGAGVELQIGETNILYGGINYNRGLTNILTNDFVLDKKELKLSADLLSLEVGIKF